jgi:arylformamidase
LSSVKEVVIQTGTKVWLDYDQAELDRQYDQGSIVVNNEMYRTLKQEGSKHARANIPCDLDVAYGPTKIERLDIYKAPKKGAPIVMFIHGGAWKNGTKNENAYAAEAFVGKGANFIVTDFALVPDVMLEEQVRQNRAAIAWVARNAEMFGGDPKRIYITGHSSGSHVCGMMLVTDWEGVYGLPADIVKGAGLASGMYDLEPVRLSSRNSYLHLDVERAQKLSSISQIPPASKIGPIKAVVSCGTGELKEFQRQSREFAPAWRAAGHTTGMIEVEGNNHFDMAQDWGRADRPLFKAMADIIGL